MGKVCEVYGFSTGGISSQHDTPSINIEHEEDHVIFSDGKALYPESFESTQQFTQKNGNSNTGGTGNVWVPTDGGTKYHSKSTCSGMHNPEKMSEEEAIEEGFSKCGRCW